MSMSGKEQLREQKRQEFEASIIPIHEWLCKYGDPYITVAVTQNRATIHHESISIPLPVPD
ncbi:MAG: hypothetical protein HFI58_02390 [Lachnospiraceae bacterium]|jgi:hypothetical protein|nr:hypothetical protein [Lachnospiraceae bacterium]MCI9013558.1 hypothetical protein [Lachnospiraceae bacterium]MCI9253676.1 hypothetical protein [Lachnospiraceae bacterium]